MACCNFIHSQSCRIATGARSLLSIDRLSSSRTAHDCLKTGSPVLRESRFGRRQQESWHHYPENVLSTYIVPAIASHVLVLPRMVVVVLGVGPWDTRLETP